MTDAVQHDDFESGLKPLWMRAQAGDEAAYREALSRIANKLRSLSPDETFWYFSGRSSNEAGFLLHLFARLYGTNNVNNCSYYCHQASGVGLSAAIGTSTLTLSVSNLFDEQYITYFGEPIYTYSLKQGIEDGFLAPYKVVRVDFENGRREEVTGTQPVTDQPLGDVVDGDAGLLGQRPQVEDALVGHQP